MEIMGRVTSQELLDTLEKVSPQARDELLKEAWEEAKKRKKAENSVYKKFQEKYFNDPVGFVRDMIDWKGGNGLVFYQNKIMEKVQEYDRVAVRGPRTLGKTAVAAILVHWYALTRDGRDWKVPTTASHWRQLDKFLWPEIHKWAGRLKWELIGRPPYNPRTELLTLSLKLNTGQAFAMASDDAETMEGAHADHLLIIFDEAKIIPTDTWDRMEGALASGGAEGAQKAKWLAISTPGAPAGMFYSLHKERDRFRNWHAVHITREEAIKAGRMSQEWADDRLRIWGEHNPYYQNHVLGEFAADDENAVIPLAWIEMAMKRGDEWRDALAQGYPKGELTSVGMDCGLGTLNSDDSTIARVYEKEHVDDVESMKFGNPDTTTMEMAGRAKAISKTFNVDVFMDTIGLGLGAYQRCKEQGVKRVHAFNAAKKAPPTMRDYTKQYKFGNMRSAAWWTFRERLDPESDNPISLPRDDQLVGELTSPLKSIKSDATLFIEKKDDIRKRLGRSTDRADAVIEAVVGPKIIKKARARVYVVGQGYTDEQ